jgi:hypothetical protein
VEGLTVALLAFLSLIPAAHAQSSSPGNTSAHAVWRDDNTDSQPWKRRVEPASRRSSGTGDRLAILAHVGIGAPAGALGMSLDLAPVRWFATNVGGGLGSAGAQFAATSRIRVDLSNRVLLGVGTGVSLGPYRSRFPSEGLGGWLTLGSRQAAILVWERAYWHNVELSVDYYPSSGTLMSHFAVGYGYIINDNARVCTDANKPEDWFDIREGCSRSTGLSLFFASAGVGFDI